MTPQEIKKAVQEFVADVGPKARVHLSVEDGEQGPVQGMLCPNGMGANVPYFFEKGDDWMPVLAALRARWAKVRDEQHRQTVEKMALEIIRLTAMHGECTDAALRAEFDAADVARWGSDAVIAANEMAERGPFEIVSLGGANAQEAAE